MSGVTAEQSGLSSYAEAVLYQNGIKSCRMRWPSSDVLSVEVDPTRMDKARGLLPIIQQRAGDQVRVELHQPPRRDPEVAEVADPLNG